MKNTQFHTYTNYLVGKQCRVRFVKSAALSKNSRSLELVHTDMYGPIDVESLGGARYFMTFIDDCTKFCFVYLLKTKDEALNYFKAYKAEA